MADYGERSGVVSGVQSQIANRQSCSMLSKPHECRETSDD
jgi:hypothetical protein